MKMNPFSNPLWEKKDAYEAAVLMLSRQDDHSLRYAALELRRCIEAIVYQKLKAYGDLLPEAATDWRPPKAFKKLIAVEPYAEETFSFAIGVQKDATTPAEGPYQTLGVDERPKAKWLTSEWNRLGAYLHAEWPFARKGKEIASARSYFEGILAQLEPFVKNDFTLVMHHNIEFECACCKATVRVMRKAVEKGVPSTCLTCGTPHRSEETEGEFTFYPMQTPFTCDCGASTYTPEQEVKIGYEFSCRQCKKRFQVAGVEWKVGELVEDASMQGSAGADS